MLIVPRASETKIRSRELGIVFEGPPTWNPPAGPIRTILFHPKTSEHHVRWESTLASGKPAGKRIVKWLWREKWSKHLKVNGKDSNLRFGPSSSKTEPFPKICRTHRSTPPPPAPATRTLRLVTRLRRFRGSAVAADRANPRGLAEPDLLRWAGNDNETGCWLESFQLLPGLCKQQEGHELLTGGTRWTSKLR